ncbi:sigma-70 family RNA polymerase sigma factor [Rubinisphaera sp.]|mgnify:FL=1|uniref:sigma-70 family RNA polymerase sigma factor n=1 Tax=Rubinisphaera sp. TaxID=2024857 RepID=UPI0025EE8D1E|nr:sigma-70 family RNA polymerase sigma factor [Rubinisphaera sp.]
MGNIRTTPLHEEAFPQSEGQNDTGPDAAFIKSFVKVQRRLYLYLLAQTGNPNSAEEILQNANVVVLAKWKDFEPGTNFLAWVYRIASLEVMKFRQKSSRNRLIFDDDYLATISKAVEEISEGADERQAALAICIRKLKARDRELIRLRYQQGNDGQSLSDQLNRPLNSIYQSLGRIRRTLMSCIEKQLATVTR